MEVMCGGVESHTNTATKSHVFLSGNVLYPCTTNTNTIQQQMANENRMLWAALTPHGTRHFVSEPFPIHDDHYEVIDYETKHNAQHEVPTIKRTPIKVTISSILFITKYGLFFLILYIPSRLIITDSLIMTMKIQHH